MQVLEAIDSARIAALRAADEYFWLDLREPSHEALGEMVELFGLSPVVAEDLEEFGQRPKLDDYDDYVHIVFFGVEGDDLVEVHMIVHGEAMVTVRRDHCESLLGAKARIEATDPSKEEYAIYRVLDALTDSYFPLLERMEDEVDEVEESIVATDRAPSSNLAAFADRRRRLSQLRRVVGPQRDMLAGAGDFMDHVPGLRSDEAHDYYRDIYDHLLRIGDGIESLRDTLTSVHDIYLSAQANRLNEVVYRLTLVGTVFLPITFITGFFGQNFGWLVNHIDRGWAFWVLGIGLELASIGTLLAWFRRAGVRQ